MFVIIDRDSTIVDLADTQHAAQGIVDWWTKYDTDAAPFRCVPA